MLGGICAGLLYDVIFASDSSLLKAKGFLLSSNARLEQHDDRKEPTDQAGSQNLMDETV